MKLVTVKTLGSKEITNFTSPKIKNSIEEIDNVLATHNNELCVIPKSALVVSGSVSGDKLIKDAEAKIAELTKTVDALGKTVDTLSKELKSVKDSMQSAATLSAKK